MSDEIMNCVTSLSMPFVALTIPLSNFISSLIEVPRGNPATKISSPPETASKPKNTKPSISSAELEKEKQKRKSLEQKLVALELEKQKRIEEERKELEKKLAALQSEKKKHIKQNSYNEIGSGFYVSKFRHIVTNQHVVNKCKKITVGENMSAQIPADLIASDTCANGLLFTLVVWFDVFLNNS